MVKVLLLLALIKKQRFLRSLLTVRLYTCQKSRLLPLLARYNQVCGSSFTDLTLVKTLFHAWSWVEIDSFTSYHSLWVLQSGGGAPVVHQRRAHIALAFLGH